MSYLRQNTNTYLTVKTNVDLSGYSNHKAYIRQEDVELEFTVAIIPSNKFCAVLGLTKAKASKLKDAPAKVQLLAQDSNGMTVTHDPVIIEVGELIWRNGYGS